jgi:hypothetical protein
MEGFTEMYLPSGEEENMPMGAFTKMSWESWGKDCQMKLLFTGDLDIAAS